MVEVVRVLGPPTYHKRRLYYICFRDIQVSVDSCSHKEKRLTEYQIYKRISKERKRHRKEKTRLNNLDSVPDTD